MTQDFKNNILAYLVGKLDIQTPSSLAPTFTNVGNITNNFNAELINAVGENYTIAGFLQSQTNNIGIIYGYNMHNNTFFVLLDETFNIIQIITNDSNGDFFPMIEILNVDEDGRFYGITREMEFIMLNNFTLKLPNQTNYEIKKTYSYNVSSSIAVNSGEVIGIKKLIGSATYLIYGNQIYQYSGNTYRKASASLLKVNVGSDNELTNFTSTSSTTGTNVYVKDATLKEENGTISFVLQCTSEVINTMPAYQELIGTYTENVTTPMAFGRYIKLGGQNAENLIMKTAGDNVYIGYNDTHDNSYYIDYINQNTLNNGFAGTIYTKELTNNLGGFSFVEQNNIVFFLLNQYNGTNYNAFVGLMKNGSIYDFESGIYDNDSIFFVNQTFNLCNLYVQDGDIAHIVQTIYNPNNYNGVSYNDADCMVPKSGILYDESEVVIFARNLYNKTVNNNTTISTIEVPNTYLNDTNIAKQNLLSNTNKLLNSNNQNISKNIYETLNINFANTLVIKNSNNPLNEIINLQGASRLNSSISSLADYEETKGTKYKVNYTNGNSNVFNIDNIDYSGNMAILEFNVYVGSAISNIQIISNDEATIYQEIDTSNLSLEIGKYYNFKQNVEII